MKLLLSCLVCGLLGFPQPGLRAAETEPAKAAATPAPEKRAPPKIKYTLPAGASGGATVRQSGGTRAAGEKLPKLSVLAPDHLALTTQAQPALFWYQSQPTRAAFQLTLTEPKKAKPLLSLNLQTAEKAGVRAVSLAKHGVTLQPNIAYRWHVALIPDPDNRSKDLLAGGMIKRIELPAELAAKLKDASSADKAAIYAEAGLWYDALQAITTAMAEEPKNEALRELRASLLKQVGLADAAGAGQ